MTTTTDRGNRDRRAEVTKGNGLCQFCPPNSGCNQYHSRKPKPDRYKDSRKGRG